MASLPTLESTSSFSIHNKINKCKTTATKYYTTTTTGNSYTHTQNPGQQQEKNRSATKKNDCLKAMNSFDECHYYNTSRIATHL
jgi:hypothetical protein